MTKIEWVARQGTIPESWNPIGGCEAISDGCQNCWAARLAATRLKHHPLYEGLTTRRSDGSYRWTGEIRLDYDEIFKPLHWHKPRTVFVTSTSDLFHYRVPDTYIKKEIWSVMVDCKQHTFLLLTKRPTRAFELLESHTPWPKNIWLGVTAENQQYAEERIPVLLQIPAAVRFVSCEPLLGPIQFHSMGTDTDCLDILSSTRWNENGIMNIPKVDWIITGGETGSRARPMHPYWARSLRNQCQVAGMSYFHKQNGEFMEVIDNFRDNDTVLMHDGKVLGRYDVWADKIIEKGYTVVRRVGKKQAGHLLNGKEYHQWPDT